MTDTERAELEAWRRLADACVEHDALAQAFALAHLHQLLQRQAQE